MIFYRTVSKSPAYDCRVETGHEAVDLIVVGFGAAGAAAAITAADLGGSVLVVEKQAEALHTCTSLIASGIVMTVNDVEAATVYLDRCASGLVPVESSRTLAERAHDLPRWLDRVGAGLFLRRVRGAQHPHLPGSESIEVYSTIQRSSLSADEIALGPGTVSDPLRGGGFPGRDFFMALRGAIERRPRIRIAWQTPASRLLRDASGAVVGVLAGQGEATTRFSARQGVVLACGGFEYDEELKLNFLPVHPTAFYGSPANTGDGVRMAQAVGAALWHMNQMTGRGTLHFELEGQPLNFNTFTYPSGSSFNEPPSSGFVITDRRGSRYANEWEQAIPVKHTFQFKMLEYDAEMAEHPRVPSFWIFDRRRSEAGPLVSLTTGVAATHYYTWSADNRVEVERGWISEGATVEAAAALAGVRDPKAAAAEVLDYNRGCQSGRDRFGRPARSLVPLDAPPFYCVALHPGGVNTSGGPKRDGQARVLDAFNDPIPGLYSAGELGQPFGLLYPASGCNLTEAICSGQAAAETALGNRSRQATSAIR